MPRDTAGLGSSPFARRYWGNRCYFLLLRVLRCFSSPRSPHAQRDGGIAPAGLPHSDIRVSPGICPSSRLFAACHVLLRLREPRHPPCALVPFRCLLTSRHLCPMSPATYHDTDLCLMSFCLHRPGYFPDHASLLADPRRAALVCSTLCFLSLARRHPS